MYKLYTIIIRMANYNIRVNTAILLLDALLLFSDVSRLRQNCRLKSEIIVLNYNECDIR